MKTLSIAILLIGCAPALAQQAIPKTGTCPDRYHASGDFCIPYANATPAFPKGSGPCPDDYHASGGSCVAYPNAKPAVERRNGATCPSGWHANGSGCSAY